VFIRAAALAEGDRLPSLAVAVPVAGDTAAPAPALDDLLGVGGLLARLPYTWWVAGGWAIDAWAGGASREHEDLEISVLRQDRAALQAHLHLLGWQLERLTSKPHAGTWAPLAPGEVVAPPDFQLRARRTVADSAGVREPEIRTEAAAPREFELFLNDLADGRWVSRRHPTVVLPLAALVVESPVGLPVLAPEVQLLYKAKYHRPKDEHDFRRALPLLSAAQRAWLAGTLCEYHPGDPWLAALSRG
jgi:hypothetical protein